MRTPKRIEDFNPLSANPTKRSNTLKQFAGKLPATLLKETLLHGCFSFFLNCINGTKSRKASRIKCSWDNINPLRKEIKASEVENNTTWYPKHSILRANVNSFGFRIGYLFCGEACVIDKKHPDWNKGLQKASTFSFKDSALAKCHKRSEKWVEDVKRRLSKSTGSCRDSTVSKVFKYRVISRPYFPVFGLNTKIY